MASAIVLGMPAPAGAINDLFAQGCFADDGMAGPVGSCTDPSKDALATADAVAASPDGKSVYVVAPLDNAISHFSRAANGSLTFIDCIATNGGSGCANPNHDAFSGATGVAVSGGAGSSVYVTAGSAVTHFTRNTTTGAISETSCVADGSGGIGCTDPNPDPLSGASDVVVRPGDADVYVSAAADNSISHLDRAGDGTLTMADCIAENGGSNCGNPLQDALTGATSVAVDPTGTHLYVTSPTESAISHFTLDAGGALSYTSCIADNGNGGVCADPGPGEDALAGATDVAVSPDGANVYVASPTDQSISRFSRGPGGFISFQDCLAEDGAGVCADPNPTSAEDQLESPKAVAVSPNGSTVYVAGGSGVAHFNRGAGGALSYQSCVGVNLNECRFPPARFALAGSTSVAVSPNSASIYATGQTYGAVTHLIHSGLKPTGECAGNDATLAGNAAANVLTGTSLRDAILGGAGNDTINGLGGSDRICGESGADLLLGGADGDGILGGTGGDRLKGEAGEDTLTGEAGPDLLLGGPEADFLFGGTQRDRLRAAGGRDELFGEGGRDRLSGGAGRDKIKGGPGRDICIGGPGRDRFRGCERRRQ